MKKNRKKQALRVGSGSLMGGRDSERRGRKEEREGGNQRAQEAGEVGGG
jgi:hypothetical protein